MQSPSRPARELGDLVRNASKHKGPWPKLSVWHGSADRTVNPGQCRRDRQAMARRARPAVGADVGGDVDGYPRQVWWNADGETIVKSYTITDMAHGTPLGIAGNDERYGAAGAFLIEAGISSSYHIANFFGLTERVRQPSEVGKAQGRINGASRKVTPSAADGIAAVAGSRRHAVVARQQAGAPRAKPIASHAPQRRGIDVSAVITRALTAAGLMK